MTGDFEILTEAMSKSSSIKQDQKKTICTLDPLASSFIFQVIMDKKVQCITFLEQILQRLKLSLD